MTRVDDHELEFLSCINRQLNSPAELHHSLVDVLSAFARTVTFGLNGCSMEQDTIAIFEICNRLENSNISNLVRDFGSVDRSVHVQYRNRTASCWHSIVAEICIDAQNELFNWAVGHTTSVPAAINQPMTGEVRDSHVLSKWRGNHPGKMYEHLIPNDRVGFAKLVDSGFARLSDIIDRGAPVQGNSIDWQEMYDRINAEFVPKPDRKTVRRRGDDPDHLKVSLRQAIANGYQYPGNYEPLIKKFGGSVGTWTNIFKSEDDLKWWRGNRSVSAKNYGVVQCSVEDPEIASDEELETVFEDYVQKNVPPAKQAEIRQAWEKLDLDAKQKLYRNLG